ncbi:hypothetical protein ES703_13458 [subsurface metagenome]
MKIRIILLTALLMLINCLALREEQDQQQRLLKREFNRCAWGSFRTCLEDFAFYLQVANVRDDWFIQEKMPTWRKLILDLYADPTLAEEEPYIYASKLLRKNLKSRIRVKFMASIYLSHFKPDTAEVRCIEEYMNKQTDEEKKRALFFIAKHIKERFYEMQYGLMKDIGLCVGVPQVDFLESPPKVDSYIPIFIANDTLLTIDDTRISIEGVPGIIEAKTTYEKGHKFCIIFLADRDVKWESIWKILEPLMELSRKKAGNFEFFFKTDAYPLDASKPNKLGLSFQLENKPLKNIDINIHMDVKGYLLANGKKQTLSGLEDLPPNKNIRFAFSKLAKTGYILRVLSLIKKSNPNDYYYVVE